MENKELQEDTIDLGKLAQVAGRHKGSEGSDSRLYTAGGGISFTLLNNMNIQHWCRREV